MLVICLVCKSVGMSTLDWSKTGKSVGFSQGNAGARGGLPTCVAKPIVGISGVLIHHGERPVRTKQKPG